MRAIRPKQQVDWLGRLVSVVGIASASVHFAMIGHRNGLPHDALMVALGSACLLCSKHLWNQPTPRHYGITALMALAMLVGHLPSGSGHAHGIGHAHGTSSSVAIAHVSPSALTTTAMVLALIEFALGYTVLHWRTRALPGNRRKAEPAAPVHRIIGPPPTSIPRMSTAGIRLYPR